nr:N-acetylmannosamine-6-phosphate 2-epimerase [Brachybacterium sp. Marseille-Q7125]
MTNTLIVSCQAYPGEPMRDPRTMAQIAAAVERGGASAVRAQGLEDIRQVKAAVSVPVIGIWKDGEQGVFITPTLEHALAVAEAGADIVALDGTLRERPDGRTLAQTVAGLRERFDGPLMADCDSVESAQAAAELGIELIGTTLAGYTDARPKTDGPDLALLRELAGSLGEGQLLVAEGRVHTPQQVAEARDAGADAVVVGTAITHPTTITTWFAEAARNHKGVDNVMTNYT